MVKFVKFAILILYLTLFFCSLIFIGISGLQEIVFITAITYFTVSLVKELTRKIEIILLLSIVLIIVVFLFSITNWYDSKGYEAYLGSIGYLLFSLSISWYFWIKSESNNKRMTVMIINSFALFYISNINHITFFIYNYKITVFFRYLYSITAYIFPIFCFFLLWNCRQYTIREKLKNRIVGLYISLPLAFFLSVFVNQSVLNYSTGSLVSDIEHLEYLYSIKMNDKGDIKGHKKVTFTFEWQDDGDLIYDDMGELLPWDQQPNIANLIRHNGYLNWELIENSVISDNNGLYQYYFTFLSDNIRGEKEKVGFLRYVQTLWIDNRVRMDSIDVKSNKKIEYIIEIPKGIKVIHNLEGDFNETVNEKGKIVQQLNSNKITSFDRNNIVINYIDPRYQKIIPFFLFEISVRKIIFWIISLIPALMLVFLGVIGDIVKSEKLKPIAEMLLIKIRVLNNTESDDKKNNT